MASLKKFSFWLISLLSVGFSITTVIKLAYFISTQDITLPTILNVVDERGTFLYPALWNTLLVGLFVVQHTGMASLRWKHILADLHLLVISRAMYVIMTCIALQINMNHWKMLPSSSAIWLIDTSNRPGLWLFFFLLHTILWCCIYFSTLLMDQMEMIGLKQVYYDYKNLREPVAYKSNEEQRLLNYMRHPGTTCLLILLWVHPVMTLQRLFFASAWTIYLLAGFSVHVNEYEYVKHQVVHKKFLIKEVHIKKMN